MPHRPLSFPLRAARPLLGILLAFLSACATQPPAAPLPANFENEVLRIVRNNPKIILESLTQYQTEQAQAEQQAAENAQRAALATLDIEALTKGSPAKGGAQGALTLVAFSDFQCPFCARSLATVREFMAAHGSEVRLVFKHLPLSDLHPQAAPAARAAWAAYQQGKFWEYHDLLFSRQRELGDALYLELAAQLGLDMNRFKADAASTAAQAAVAADVAWASRLGINATPHFLLGHTAIAGALPLTAFEAALDAERKRQK